MSITRRGLFNIDPVELLQKRLEHEVVAPDPKLLEGTTWDVNRYRNEVTARIHLREELLLKELKIDQGAFDIVCRLQEDPGLLTRVKAFLQRNDLDQIFKQRVQINDEEWSVYRAWSSACMSRCERCQEAVATWHVIRGQKRLLCEACAKRLARHQRTTSTNIGPALKEARRLKLPVTLTLEEWLQTVARFEDLCAYCGDRWEVVEHATPTQREGGMTFANCLPSCESCNHFKSSQTLEEWLTNVEQAEQTSWLRPYVESRAARLQQALAWLRQQGRAH